MNEKKYIVPEGMLKAVEGRYRMVYSSGFNPPVVRANLEAALRWLSENPIVPTDQQEMEIYKKYISTVSDKAYPIYLLKEWQRRMFLAPEPEVPEAVKDILYVRGIAGADDVIDGIPRGEYHR